MAKTLDELLDDARKLRASIQISRTVNINKTSVRTAASAIVQLYFREVRADVMRHTNASQVAELDEAMQRLNILSIGRNAKASYLTVLKAINDRGTELAFVAARTRSDTQAANTSTMNDVEARIHTTLLAMLPAASNSYKQAVVDLRSERFSYRGPASDLREALREVLDHMAPDAAVMSAQGFKLEANRAGPTMAQKARFILRQRDTSESVARPALESTALVDTMTAGMVRSTYTSGAVNVHVSPTRAEVQQLKLHVDSALARLLGIFG